MSNLGWWAKAGAVFVFCTVMAISSQAQTFTTLVIFDQANGGTPVGSLVQGPDGSFYGATENGGSRQNCAFSGGCGTVFKIAPGGILTTLYTFCVQTNCTDGANPSTGLVLATDGSFYGATGYGGADNGGTIFKITSQGKFTTVHSFNGADGAGVEGPLVQGIDGYLYGTTEEGGVNNEGTVFKMTPDGTLATLHKFDAPNGGFYPQAGLVQATDGNFYGTTAAGGRGGGVGTIFRITPKGAFGTLFSFCEKCNAGVGPSDLIQAADGYLYGTTEVGPYGGDGSIFEITAKDALTTLYTFGGADGNGPIAGLIQGNDGNFYGTTVAGGDLSCDSPYGCGTIFKFASDGTLTTLHNFEVADGELPERSLLQSTNGVFYGTTLAGGNNIQCSAYYTGCGTVFSLSTGLGPFVTFVRAAGRVGQTGGILGQALTGTTSVSFNGTPATFTVVSDTLIKATVPVGATTGYVTVTTPSGTLTSNVPFHVIK